MTDETFHVKFTESRLAFKRWFDKTTNRCMAQVEAEDLDKLTEKVEELEEELETLKNAAVRKMELNEGDVVVLESQKALPEEAIERLRHSFALVTEHPCVVLEDGLHVACVLSKDDAPPEFSRDDLNKWIDGQEGGG